MLRQTLAKAMPRGFKERVKEFVRANVGVGGQEDLGLVFSRIDTEITTIFDIGANIGDVTLMLLERFPRATVFAFEPCSTTFQRLSERVAASPMGDRVRLFNHGFYNEEGSRTLHVTSHHGANSLLDITPEYREMNPQVVESSSESIKLVRMDDFVAQNAVGHIDLMKIDVEGAEYEVLAGGRRTLESSVDVVLCELSMIRWPRAEGRYIQILQLMHECGFAPAELYDIAQGDPQDRRHMWRLAQLDCVFRRYDA